MPNSEKESGYIKVFGNTSPAAGAARIVTGAAATALIDKLVYSAPLANDHLLHALEERYGAVIAYDIMEKMPK